MDYVKLKYYSKIGITTKVIKESELRLYEKYRIKSIEPTTKEHYERCNLPGKSKIKDYLNRR